MADTSASNQNRTANKAQAQAEQAQPERPTIDLRSGRPIVIKVKKGGRKKRKYSRSLKGPQQGLRDVSKAGHRLARAITSGFAKYRKKADKSSKKKRDGLLKDVFRNSASGFGLSMRKSSKVPALLVRRLGKGKRRGLFRIGSLSRLTGIFGRY